VRSSALFVLIACSAFTWTGGALSAGTPSLRSGIYAGRTSQGQVIRFTAKGSPTVDLWNVSVRARTTCDGGGKAWDPISLPLVLGDAGRIFAERSSGTAPTPGETRQLVFKARSVASTKAAGTIRDETITKTSPGRRHCVSGLVTWTSARH
jgi:hypothetical protein